MPTQTLATRSICSLGSLYSRLEHRRVGHQRAQAATSSLLRPRRVRTSVLGALACLFAFAVFPETLLADTMYVAVGNGSPVNKGAVLIVDQTNGSGALLGDPVTPGGLSGIDFDANYDLFGTTVSGFNTTSSLVEIDPLTGALVDTVGAIVDSVNSLPLSIGDLAYDRIGEILFGTRSATDGQGLAGELYTIDTSTGVATLIGDTDVASSGGLAFAPDGTLYFVAVDNGFNNVLTTLDASNASILTTVALTAFFDGLAVRPDGVLFATGSGMNNDGIFKIAPGTGVSTLLGSTGAGSGSDLAFAILASAPVPVLGPLGMGLLATLLGSLVIYRARRFTQ